MALHPNQFQINEAWIAFKLNDAPVSAGSDGDINVIALMDAASCYIFGTEFIRSGAVELSQLESKRLFGSGWSHKEQYPKKLFISAEQPAEILGKEAEAHGVFVTNVPDIQLSVFIDEARQGFQEHVSKGRRQ